MNMCNASCVRTQTSKVPTSVAFLFISYSMLCSQSTKNCLRYWEFDTARVALKGYKFPEFETAGYGNLTNSHYMARPVAVQKQSSPLQYH